MNKIIETMTKETVTREDGGIKLHVVREIKINYERGKMKNFAMNGSDSAANTLRGILPDNSREHCVALYLDRAHRVAGFAIISTGTATQTFMNPSEIFQRALIVGAGAIILGHNHPSGSASPSSCDEAATERLCSVGQLIGIPVLDHIIIGGADHYSFADEGKIVKQKWSTDEK